MAEQKRIPELGDRTWDELEIVEHGDGTLLFSDKLRKRNAKGGVDEIPVRVCVVRSIKIAEARAETRAWCKELKIDPALDRDIFDNLEQLTITARAIRTHGAPYAQFATKEELATDYDEASIWDIKGRIEAIREMMDPRESELEYEQIWSKIAAVAKAGNLLPLTGIAGREQLSLVVFMAGQALSSPTGVAWQQSHATSTQGQSTTSSSMQSSEAAG